VLTDQRLADEMSQRGTELIEASYSWDAIAGRTIDVYDRALGR